MGDLDAMPTAQSPRIALAWRNLTEKKLRMATSLAGVAFAVTLMLMQMGFRNALLDSMTAILRHLDGQLVLIPRSLYTLGKPQAIPLRRLEQARAFDGVEAAIPLYVETRQARWRNPDDGLPRRVRVVAYPPESDLLDIPEVRSGRERWARPETALGDRLSRPEKFGRMAEGVVSELSGRRVRLVGSFELGADFQNDGTLLMSEENYFRYFPGLRGPSRGETTVALGVIRLATGADAGRLRRAIQAAMPGDVRVLTKDEFVAKERAFWDRVAPLGTIFNIGVVMGFVVGTAICYQILSSDIADRLPQFATLKAMGYSDGWLARVILTQATYLAVLGYAVGLGVGRGLFEVVHLATGLPMEFKPVGAATIFALTLLMCGLSGLLAARKLLSLDPANLFS